MTADGVPMSGRGRAAFPAHGPIAAGGRDDAGTREAGRLSRAVLAGQLVLWEATFAMHGYCDRFEGPDKPEAAKFEDKFLEFLRRDSVVLDKGKTVHVPIPGVFDADGEPALEELRRLPFGWDDGLSLAELMRWGLDRVQTAYGERYIARHYNLIANTGQLVDTRTGEMLPMSVVLNRGVGVCVAFHPQTRRQEDTVKQHWGLRRVDYAKLRPAEPPGIVKEPPYEFWNTWRVCPVQPMPGVSDADIEPFLRLVRMMFPDARERGHLLDWIAHMVQHPGVKMMHAVLIISEANGEGKGTLAGCIGDLFHPSHRAEVSVEVMRSDFNAHWARDRVFVFVDEVQSTDRMDVTNYLKTLITSREVTINQKHVPAYDQENLINVMLASNKADALYLDPQDRRFFVLRIEDEDAARILWDFDFDAFTVWWGNSLNRGRLLGWLLARDLSGFNPKGHAPMTAGKEALLDLTRPRWDALLRETLDTGAGVFGKGVVTVEDVGRWLAEHRVDKSPAHVREWCKRAGLVPVLDRVRVPRRGEGTGTVKATVWAVRDAEHWRAAGKDAVLAELAKGEPFETAAGRARREAGDHTSKKGESI